MTFPASVLPLGADLVSAGEAVARALPSAAGLIVEPVDQHEVDIALEAGVDVRAVVGRLGGVPGTLILMMSSAMAETTETLAADLVSALLPALETAAEALGAVLGSPLELEAPQEVDATIAYTPTHGQHVAAVQLVEGDVAVATFAVAFDAVDDHNPVSRGSGDAAGADSAQQAHEFQPLIAGGPVTAGNGSLDLLADVEMGVTAELGRTRMLVRDILALAPGSVIELDRAAGAPVDVLVNGTLIARGEVVVIDEEFGIRISEIIGHNVEGHRPRR